MMPNLFDRQRPTTPEALREVHERRLGRQAVKGTSHIRCVYCDEPTTRDQSITIEEGVPVHTACLERQSR